MKRIALLSQKGGVGKSTLATQLAVLATQREELACIIDLDPQGSSKLWRDFRKHARLPLVQAALPERLLGMIAAAEPLGVTVVLIDTAPHSDKSALEAVRAADLVVCPTKPDLLNLGALRDTVTLLDLANSKAKALAVINDLPTSTKSRSAALGMATAALTEFEIPIAKQSISHSQAIVDAIAEGKGITEKSKGSAAAKEIIALWEEIESRLPDATVREAAQ